MTTTAEQGQVLIERIFEELANQRKLDLIDELFTEDYVEHSPMGEVRGREALKQYFQSWFSAFPDMKMSVSDLVTEGDLAYWTVSYTGTNTGEVMGMPPTGKKVDVRVALNKGIMRDGKAAEHWQGNDALDMMQQLGMMPQQ